MIQDEQLHVVVSGSSVYKAVKSYLDSSGNMQKSIDETIQKMLDEGALRATLERQAHNTVNSYMFQSEIRKAIQKAVNEVVHLEIKQIVEASVKDALKNAVLVIPKV